MAGERSVKLIVTREHGYMGALRSLPVSVNGNLISLRNGRRAEMDISPGTIEICTTMDWAKPSCWALTTPDYTEQVEVCIRDRGAVDFMSLSQKQYTATIGDSVGAGDVTLQEVELSSLSNPVKLSEDNKARDAGLLVGALLGAVAWIYALCQMALVGENVASWVLASGLIGFVAAFWCGMRLYVNEVNVDRYKGRR